MNKQTIIGGLVALVIIGGGGFYGGMTYAKTGTPMRGPGNGQFMGNGQFPGGGMRGGMNGGGFTAGEIISKDASSITIKMQDGSTKIVLVSGSTQVTKSATGSLDDLSTGTNVVVTGSANSDGSITSQSVQIRPAGAPAFMPGQPRTTQ